MKDTFVHKKSLGQHFLNNDYAPKKMCDAANLQAGEVVLEIGPGTGALTKEILQRGATVIALEADLRAIESLQQTFRDEIISGQLTLHHHDARTIDPTLFGLKGGTYKVIANIPYYISGLLFRTLLETEHQPTILVFLVQKEVAVRIARDKKESLLSLSIKVFGDPTYICTVSKNHFTPPPRVDSAVIAIRNISKKRLQGIPQETFFHNLHLGFGQKRKQLLGNMAHLYGKEAVLKSLQLAGLAATTRAEDMTLSDWVIFIHHLVHS